MEISWTEDLATGVTAIDNQHKELFQRVANLAAAVERGDTAAGMEIFAFLVDYVIEHFGTEESLMLRHSYDQFEEHRAQHTGFMLRVYEVKKAIDAKGLDKELMTAVRDEVVAWLVNHISVRDKKMGAAVAAAVSA